MRGERKRERLRRKRVWKDLGRKEGKETEDKDEEGDEGNKKKQESKKEKASVYRTSQMKILNTVYRLLNDKGSVYTTKKPLD